jgi:hypothetical protein
MQPECSQDTATGPYPESDESNPHLLTVFLEDPLQYYPLTYVLVFQVVSSFQVFRPKFCMHFSSLTCLVHAPPISSSIICLLITEYIYVSFYLDLLRNPLGYRPPRRQCTREDVIKICLVVWIGLKLLGMGTIGRILWYVFWVFEVWYYRNSNLIR